MQQAASNQATSVFSQNGGSTGGQPRDPTRNQWISVSSIGGGPVFPTARPGTAVVGASVFGQRSALHCWPHCGLVCSPIPRSAVANHSKLCVLTLHIRIHPICDGWGMKIWTDHEGASSPLERIPHPLSAYFLWRIGLYPSLCL